MDVQFPTNQGDSLDLRVVVIRLEGGKLKSYLTINCYYFFYYLGQTMNQNVALRPYLVLHFLRSGAA